MTLHPARPYFTPPRARPGHTPRLRLKSKAPSSGAVDGAWWPRTRTLTRELPDLLEVLSLRLGPVQRVLYNVDEWAPAPTRIFVAGSAVRLDGYPFQPVDTIYVAGPHRTKIVLLVVPPRTDPDSANDILTAAAKTGSRTSTTDLLTAGAVGVAAREEGAAAQQRWESDGGGGSR